ncbi:hypothetical protein SAMN02745664_11844 [Moraxella cuniculi DSM 21768]|uniref:Uncharacterized protein n=1 Tax=Moraxella cuniculi DSM 21768 TaxID=1122245 RepID=A0A1N7FXC0_9GAMM|nr:hypothetical protein [Moraxella cuniculi]OOS03649.1 hypothetical protein B0189_09005 [Moraxella cuniculi]SIS04885.1 hypothetical protein SAMN02745664_11844 [Moraxella cuniculi DSM 21768]
MARSISSSDGKITRPVGFSASINFGSVIGGEKDATAIDEVIKGSSIGVQACHGVCLGGIRTKGKENVLTYGVGTSQISMSGGNMVQLSEERKQQLFTLLGIKP